MTVTSTPVWHDIFRKITLKPDNITLEAETYEDTLNIVRGPGVSFGSANIGTDTFEINVDYDISVPAATTKISLEDVNGNLSEITLTPGRGIAINRISAQELEFESFSVTETDTLHTVTERNNITSNKIFVNNIEVGTIASNTSEDGFTGYDAGHNLIGDGTLDNPMRFSPLYQDSLVANNTDQFEFVAVGPGTLAYAANYVFDTSATTGSVTLEREDPANPGNWTTLDTQSGNTAGIAYFIDGTYSELYSGSVTYRLTFSWTGNTGTATWYTNDTFEGGAYTPIANPQIKTDTDAKTVDINDIQFFQNTIRTTASNTDVVFDLSGSGQVRVLGNITTDMLYGNVTGNLTGNADTVTNGVYTNGLYSNPTWITSLDGIKITNAVLTTGSYYDPSWITGLDASKIIGEINLSNIIVDGTIRIFDNVIETTISNADLELRPSGTGQVRIIGDVSANMLYGDVTGNINGNASTVTDGVYTTGSYADPSWITSLDGSKIINGVLTTGSYADPSWITSLDASKIVGEINLSNIIVDGTIRIFDNVIETTISNADLELRASGTGQIRISDNLTVQGNVTISGYFSNGTQIKTGTTASDTINLSAYDVDGTTYTNLITLTAGNTPTLGILSIGALSISSAAVGSMDNVAIGGSTPSTGAFTSLSVGSTLTLRQTRELVNIGTAPTAAVTIDVLSGAVYYYTNNSTTNWTISFRGNAGTTMDSFLSVGQSTTVAVYVTNSSPAFYNTQVQVDGTTVGVTAKWFGGSAPSAGNANSVDFYTYNIVKTAASTYTVFASLNRYA